jgi:hypothetical protein
MRSWKGFPQRLWSKRYGKDVGKGERLLKALADAAQVNHQFFLYSPFLTSSCENSLMYWRQ